MASSDREMEKQLDLAAIKRHRDHWQCRPQPFIGVNVPFHSGGDNVDFVAAIKRPLFPLETVHHWVNEQRPLSTEEQ